MSECTPCDEVGGISCAANATIKTFIMYPGYWRHSDRTSSIWRCKSYDDWSPCTGGHDMGHEGDGYCNAAVDGGYRGPRCESCVAESHYFDKLDARCHSCGDVTAKAAVMFTVLPLLFLIAGFGGLAARRRHKKRKCCESMFRRIYEARRLWRKAGMRYKVKVLIGFYQCVAAIPSVFNVIAPPAVHNYGRCVVQCTHSRDKPGDHNHWTANRRWMNVIELPSDFGAGLIVRASCLGAYQRCATSCS